MKAHTPYRKVEIQMWGDAKFRALSPLPPSGQSLWLYLLTNPHMGALPGLFTAGRAAMAEELGWPLEAFDEAFNEAFQQGMVEADWKARVVWMRNALRPSNAPESPNVAVAWRRACDCIPECPLKAVAIAEIRAFLETRGRAYLDAFDRNPQPQQTQKKPFTKSSVKPSTKSSRKVIGKPSANQEQEQEQRTDDDRAQPRAPESSSVSAPAPVDLHGWRIAAMELLELWGSAGPPGPRPVFDQLTADSRRKLREALAAKSLDAWEAVFARAARSDYLAGRGEYPPITLWKALAWADRIEAGEFDTRVRTEAPAPADGRPLPPLWTAEDDARLLEEQRVAAEIVAARKARGELPLSEQIRQKRAAREAAQA